MERQQREAVMIVASAIKPAGVFRRNNGSLREFLDDYAANASSNEEIATKLFEYFCFDETGKFNNFTAGVRLALAFLDKVTDGPNDASQREQALKDLKGLLVKGDIDAVRQWITSNYG